MLSGRNSKDSEGLLKSNLSHIVGFQYIISIFRLIIILWIVSALAAIPFAYYTKVNYFT